MSTLSVEALPHAAALEDWDPLELVGDEAPAPAESGTLPAHADLEPEPGEGVAAAPQPAPQTAPAPGGWRAAGCLLALRAEIDARWPHRDRRTDGTIGDAHHCGNGRHSDHCPNGAGVVRALDVDVDGIPAAWLAEHLRALGASGDKRLADGGYVIFNRRIASWSHGWAWRAYTGDSPHTDHVHVSVSTLAAGYDASGGWGVRGAKPDRNDDARPPLVPEYELGSRVLRLDQPPMCGTDVAFVQRWVGADDDGVYGKRTRRRVRRFQRIVDLEPSGVVAAPTWRAMRVR